MRITILGLGRMGTSVARRLLEAGHEITLYNRTPGRQTDLAGARLAETLPDAVANAQVALTLVSDDAAEEALTFGPGGLVRALGPGAIHLCMSTIGPDTSRRLADAHAKAGQGYVAAPVLGKPGAVANRHLWILAGGPENQITRCMVILEALGRSVTRVGNDPALAHALKLGASALTVTLAQGLAEVLALGEKAGYPASDYSRILNLGLFKSPLMDAFAGLMVRHDHQPADETLDLASKDLALVLRTAAELKVAMPMAAPLLRQVDLARARGLGGLDLTALALASRQEAGLEGPVPPPPPALVHPIRLEHQAPPLLPPPAVPPAMPLPAVSPEPVVLAEEPVPEPVPTPVRAAEVPKAVPEPVPPVKPEPAAEAEPVPALVPEPSSASPVPVEPPPPPTRVERRRNSSARKREEAERRRNQVDASRRPAEERPVPVPDPVPDLPPINWLPASALEETPVPAPIPEPAPLPEPEPVPEPLPELVPIVIAPPPPRARPAAVSPVPAAPMPPPHPEGGQGLVEGSMFLVRNAQGPTMLDLAATTHFEDIGGVIWAWSKGTRFATPWRNFAEVEVALGHVLFVRVHRGLMMNPQAVADIKPLFGGRAKVTMLDGTEILAGREAAKRLKFLLGM